MLFDHVTAAHLWFTFAYPWLLFFRTTRHL